MTLGLVADPAAASSFFSQFIDPTDGQVDVSQWVLDNKGFLPVPIIITEPALDNGVGVAAAFFHETKDEAKEQSTTDLELQSSEDDYVDLPPSVTVAFGAVTGNGSWLLGGGHLGVWKQDHIRYLGAVGLASLDLQFYGFGDDSDIGSNGLQFNVDGSFIFQDIKFRIPDTNLFLGGRLTLLDSDASFDDGAPPPDDSADQLSLKSFGIGPVLKYDSRDNIFTPNKGMDLSAEAVFYESSLIGDVSYEKYKAAGLFFWPARDNLVLGGRLDGRFSTGDIPFWDKPMIELRGIRLLRYQDDVAVMTEAEARWRFYKRWSLVGFGGVGWTASSAGDIGDDTDAKWTRGVGLRYFIARRLRLHSGFDVARGPEETIFYLQVGSAWY
jgi:hypothetical protein